jgi:hypothetical protein
LPAANVAGDLHPPSYLDTAIGPPRGGRWGGTRPEITPARAAAIAQKRAYERAKAEGAFDHAATPAAFLAACRDARPLVLAALIPALAELAPRALRLFAALSLTHRRHGGGPLLTHAVVAEGLACSVSSARRAFVQLLERGYAWVVAPDFEQHGAASSRRGNLVGIPPNVLDSLERARALFKLEQASGTDSEQESKPSGSSQPPGGLARPEPAALVRALCPSAACGQTETASPVVGPAAPARTAGRPVAAVGPVRPIPTRTAPPEGLGGDGFDELRALAAGGDTFAAELLAQIDRDRQRRVAFGTTPKDPHVARELALRARAEENDGDATN